MVSAHMPAIASEAKRHPYSSIEREMAGRKINWPVAKAVPRMPSTRPRRCANHRFAISAPNTRAVEPVPSPTTTPHRMTSCHDAVMKTVSPVPRAMRPIAPAAMRAMPNLSMSDVAKGAVTP